MLILLGVSLDQDGVRLNLFNELLSPLGEHGGLIHRSNQVDFLAIEALSQVHEGSVEAVLSIANSYQHILSAYLSPTLS